jgi:hypothetical protein
VGIDEALVAAGRPLDGEESRRGRVSTSFFLIALSLGGFASVNVSDTTRYVLLTMGAVAMVISLWLLWTDREEGQQLDPKPGQRVRLGVLGAASVVSWGGLGVAAGTGRWAAAAVAAVAAIPVTGAIWRSISLGSPR